jgi:DNA-binding transcriptional LysR family regulator
MLYNDIALFVSVANTLNFSKAAEALNIPASRVSRRLAELEEQLGSKLFERTTRSVRLTEEGRLLLDRCQKPIEELREIGGTISLESKSTIRLTAPSLSARTTIAPKLLDFAAENPSVSIDFISSNENLDFIRDNIDLAFRLGPISDESLIAKPLWNTPYTFCAGAGFVERHGLESPISRQTLLKLPAIMFTSEWPVEEGENIVPPNVVHTFNEFELALGAVERNLGAALLPTEMLTKDISVLHVDNTKPALRTMCAVYPSRRLLPARVRSLIDFMAASV